MKWKNPINNPYLLLLFPSQCYDHSILVITPIWPWHQVILLIKFQEIRLLIMFPEIIICLMIITMTSLILLVTSQLMPFLRPANLVYTQSNFFAAGCKIMQHYVTNLYNIMQSAAIYRCILPPYRREQPFWRR